MHSPTRRIRSNKRQQLGAAGIELAFGFVMFFMVFYAFLSYAVLTLVQLGLTQAAEEGARSALQLNPTLFTGDAQFKAAAGAVVKSTVTNAVAWLPTPLKNQVLGTNGIQVTFSPDTISVNTSSGPRTFAIQTVTVTVTVPDYKNNALLPVLKVWDDWGEMPPLPPSLSGQASARVTPSFTPKTP